jgi:hypothetical protein
MLRKVLVESFDIKDELEYVWPHPVAGKTYPADLSDGIWNVLLEDGTQVLIPVDGQGAWFTAKLTEVKNSPEVITPEILEDDPLDSVFEAICKIEEADIYMTDGLASLLCHIADTYSDKYEEAQPMVDNTWLKYGEGKYPAGHNVGQAVNYLKRYLSEGYSKSYNKEDLKKAAHFILFELARRENEV